jgi:sirohydrochlorin ferrochelatase
MSSKKALLVMAHGSPQPEANKDLYDVVEIARQRNIFDIVKLCFLECNEPSIGEAIDQCVEDGAARIVAVPYFLHTGNHVAGDLPAMLDEGRRRHPSVEFAMGRYLGESERLTEILKTRVDSALRKAAQ